MSDQTLVLLACRGKHRHLPKPRETYSYTRFHPGSLGQLTKTRKQLCLWSCQLAQWGETCRDVDLMSCSCYIWQFERSKSVLLSSVSVERVTTGCLFQFLTCYIDDLICLLSYKPTGGIFQSPQGMWSILRKHEFIAKLPPYNSAHCKLCTVQWGLKDHIK